LKFSLLWPVDAAYNEILMHPSSGYHIDGIQQIVEILAYIHFADARARPDLLAVNGLAGTGRDWK